MLAIDGDADGHLSDRRQWTAARKLRLPLVEERFEMPGAQQKTCFQAEARQRKRKPGLKKLAPHFEQDSKSSRRHLTRRAQMHHHHQAVDNACRRSILNRSGGFRAEAAIDMEVQHPLGDSSCDSGLIQKCPLAPGHEKASGSCLNRAKRLRKERRLNLAGCCARRVAHRRPRC